MRWGGVTRVSIPVAGGSWRVFSQSGGVLLDIGFILFPFLTRPLEGLGGFMSTRKNLVVLFLVTGFAPWASAQSPGGGMMGGSSQSMMSSQNSQQMMAGTMMMMAT